MNEAHNIKSSVVGRFAPTPSGDMHLGNLLCALVAYLSAKSKGGKFIVRIEDLDPIRSPRAGGEKILDTLCRFGLVSDEPPIFQSDRSELYREKALVLERMGLTYPCYCSRAELHAAEAPRVCDGAVVYSRKCFFLSAEEKAKKELVRKPCLRVKVPNEVISFTDAVYGDYSQNLETECGDFIIRRSDGVYAYQLAVTVDDGEQGVTEVVRGEDLLSSTPRQIYLMRLLGYMEPKYLHIPLVCDSFGRKLSKTEGDRIAESLKRLPKERILGALGYAIGIIERDRAADLSELTGLFSADKITRGAVRLPESL
ncbi:MAG: tRNA glutamyl-Q(34) synthetase GluQRS [Clostridiales bacterium]|nr:tRNA glutamyl-Q(34) synthetase GluQRS [Clostridiales bacterium]